jgi:hypothetical protein
VAGKNIEESVLRMLAVDKQCPCSPRGRTLESCQKGTAFSLVIAQVT